MSLPLDLDPPVNPPPKSIERLDWTLFHIIVEQKKMENIIFFQQKILPKIWRKNSIQSVFSENSQPALWDQMVSG